MPAAPVLGINAFHADAAAAGLADGQLVAAVEEERFRRVKHWAGFPEEAIHYFLRAMGEDAERLAALAVSRQPRAYLWRKALLAATHPRSLRRAASRVQNLAAVAGLRSRVSASLGKRSPRLIVPVEHHLAHMASAFFCSPFEEAMCLTVDGFGDFVSTMMAVGRANRIEVLRR